MRKFQIPRMLLESHILEFDQFALDLSDKTLYRGGKSVNLSLKSLEILLVLIEQRPRVVDKATLIAAVWPDSIVEEGNLTFAISQLRKVLNDTKSDSHIIETVHRRGYRFIADVRPSSDGNGFKPKISDTGETLAENDRTRRRWVIAVFASLLLAGFGAMGVSIWRDKTLAYPFLSGSFEVEKLSTDGSVAYAVLSSDEKFIVYTNGTSRGKESIWLRQLESGGNVELIAASDDKYFGLDLSPDSNFLYFVRGTGGNPLTIFRVSIFGGIPVKIAEKTQGWISISPDGRFISYVRCYFETVDGCSLFVANAVDGSGERRLVTRASPFQIGDNEFSPDGSSIAFAHGQTVSGGNEFSVADVDLESGTEMEVWPEKFFNVKSLLWLPDRSLLVTANKNSDADMPIWHLPRNGQNAVRLMKDSEVYSGLSGVPGGNMLVATRVKKNTRIRVFDFGEASEKYSIRDASHVAFSGTDHLVLTGLRSGNSEIWATKIDGSELRQLTNAPSMDITPITSYDGRSILFASNRSGSLQIWRMNNDGSDQRQITASEGGWPVFVTPDGKWVYYLHGLHRTLWRVAAAGGGEQSFLNIRSQRYSFSPDGSQVLIVNSFVGGIVFQTLTLPEGNLVKTFQSPKDNAEIVEHAWSRDGSFFAFVLTDKDTRHSEVWSQTLTGGDPQKIADIGFEAVHHFALAPDGLRLATVQGEWKHDAILIKAQPK